MRCRAWTVLWLLPVLGTGLFAPRECPGQDALPRQSASARASYKALLPAGETFDAGELWDREWTAFDRRLTRMQSKLVELPLGEGRLQFTRNMAALHGVLSGESAAGQPMLSVQYRDGHRQGTLLARDSRGRPLLLAQYDRKKLHGWRCVFVPCSEECGSSHLTLLEKWERGRLEESYFISGHRAVPVRVEDSHDPARRDPAYAAARRLLSDFEEQYAASEKQLKTLIREEGRASGQQSEFEAAALPGALLAEAVNCGFL